MFQRDKSPLFLKDGLNDNVFQLATRRLLDASQLVVKMLWGGKGGRTEGSGKEESEQIQPTGIQVAKAPFPIVWIQAVKKVIFFNITTLQKAYSEGLKD